MAPRRHDRAPRDRLRRAGRLHHPRTRGSIDGGTRRIAGRLCAENSFIEFATTFVAEEPLLFAYLYGRLARAGDGLPGSGRLEVDGRRPERLSEGVWIAMPVAPAE